MRVAARIRVAVAAGVLALPARTLPGQVPGNRVEAPRIELVRELVIGADSVRPEYQFTAIGYVAATHSGSIFVTGGLSEPIRKYHRTGRYRGSIGRVGSGPGEYRLLEGMAVVADTLLVVFDWGNGRLVVFDTSGAYRRTFRAPSGTFSSPFQAFAAFGDGTVGVRVRTIGGWNGEGGTPSVFVRYRPDGTLVDSIRVPAEAVAGIATGSPLVGWRWAFPATTVFALLPSGGVAVAQTTKYSIEVTPPAGRPFTIERETVRMPIEGGEREEWEAMARMAASGPRPQTVSIPRHKPIIRGLFADLDGRLWVDLYTRADHFEPTAPARPGRSPGLTWWEHNAYDVFDQRGAYLGRVDLPAWTRLVTVVGTRVWLAEQTEDGDRVLVRYEMRVARP